MSKIIIGSFFLVLFLIGMTESTLTQGGNPVCSTTGASFTLAVESPSAFDQDHSSFFYRYDTDDSVRLFVKEGDETNNFKFLMFDVGFTSPEIVECADSIGMKFVSLVNEFLVVKSDDGHFVCRFDQSLDGPSVQLLELDQPAPGVFASVIESVLPYYWNLGSYKLYVLMNDATQSKIISYAWPTSSLTPDITSVAPQVVDTLQNKISSMVGLGGFGFEPGTVAVMSKQGTLVVDPVNFPTTATSVVKIMSISQDHAGLTILTANSLSGTAYFVGAGGSIKETIPLPSATIRAYESETDTISNFVIWGESFFYWANNDYDSYKRSYKLTTNDIDTEGVISVALTANKAILLYEDHLSYYRMTGYGLSKSASKSTDIEFLFTKTFTASAIEADGAYRFGLSCLCKGMKKFACFSSTLNCLIVRVADTACGNQDFPVSEQD